MRKEEGETQRDKMERERASNYKKQRSAINKPIRISNLNTMVIEIIKLL